MFNFSDFKIKNKEDISNLKVRNVYTQIKTVIKIFKDNNYSLTLETKPNNKLNKRKNILKLNDIDNNNNNKNYLILIKLENQKNINSLDQQYISVIFNKNKWSYNISKFEGYECLIYTIVKIK